MKDSTLYTSGFQTSFNLITLCFCRLTQYDRQILVPRAMYKQEIDGLKSNTTYEVVVKATLTSLDNIISSRPLRQVWHNV